jgi:hypothetical protein
VTLSDGTFGTDDVVRGRFQVVRMSKDEPIGIEKNFAEG